MSPADDDRPKPTFSERDRMRREGRQGEPRPRGRWAEAEARRATEQYKRGLDGMFSTSEGGAEGAALAEAMRAAHGTPGLAAACTAYRDGVGWPAEAELLSLFFDCGERELVVGALETALEAIEAGRLEPSKGLRRQIASLAEDFDSAIADVAEEILERL